MTSSFFLGYVTETAANGLEACQMMEAGEGSYDAILLDLHMPVMDGIEATRFIRTNLDKLIPILIISAEQGTVECFIMEKLIHFRVSLGDSKEAAVAAGADGSLDKPAMAKDVISKMKVIIAEKTALKAAASAAEVNL